MDTDLVGASGPDVELQQAGVGEGFSHLPAGFCCPGPGACNRHPFSFRGVPADRFDEIRRLFLRIRDEFGVPLEVVNDGDVTALAGAMCIEDTGVLGIALGSAVKTAQVHNADNRIMYSGGVAAIDLGLMGKDCTVAYAIPLSATGKNIFFDRS